MGIWDRLLGRKGSEVQQAEEPQHQQNEQQEHDEEQGYGALVGFVLLREDSFDYAPFIQEMRERWGIDLSSQGEPEDGAFVFEVNGMRVACMYVPAPVPNREAEENCRYNLIWPEAEQAVSQHQAQLILSVLNYDHPIEGHALFTKAASSLLQSGQAIGLYMAPAVLEAGHYTELAQTLQEDELPIPLWVFVGLYGAEQGNSAYTVGLNKFGRDELEVVESDKTPGELYEFMYMITQYLIEYDVVLRDGETIGFSEEQKLTLTRSKGIAVEGDSIKIGY